MEELPATKDGQERAVGKRFASYISELTGTPHDTIQLNERDQDFVLKTADTWVEVQATEIVPRDYLAPLSLEDYRTGRHDFHNFVYLSPDKIFGIDIGKRDRVLLEKVLKKIGKHYQKPPCPLWLLIWTVCTDFVPFWSEGGAERVSLGVDVLREYLARSGTGPFDEIWFLPMLTRPERIWPE